MVQPTLRYTICLASASLAVSFWLWIFRSSTTCVQQTERFVCVTPRVNQPTTNRRPLLWAPACSPQGRHAQGLQAHVGPRPRVHIPAGAPAGVDDPWLAEPHPPRQHTFLAAMSPNPGISMMGMTSKGSTHLRPRAQHRCLCHRTGLAHGRTVQRAADRCRPRMFVARMRACNTIARLARLQRLAPPHRY